LEEVKWRLVTKWNVDFSFAVATFFIIGSYIVYQQIDYMNKKDLGFKANQILSISYRNVYGEITDNFRFDRYLTIKMNYCAFQVKQVAGGFAFGGSAKSTITLQ
jgi:putative ABC transport system permease protein